MCPYHLAAIGVIYEPVLLEMVVAQEDVHHRAAKASGIPGPDVTLQRVLKPGEGVSADPAVLELLEAVLPAGPMECRRVQNDEAAILT
jgi:hypothetical protein